MATHHRLILSCALFGAVQGLLAQEPQPPQHPPTLEEFLREIAGQYDIGSLFRFDPPQEQSKEPIFNQPEALGFQVERRIDKLPRSGRAETVPWSGWWWPMSKDGIAAGGSNSPIARYAKARGLGEAPTQWEREHHGTAGQHKPEAWWGHCNGWAAAAILEPVAQTDVQVGGVTLTPTDLSALMTAVYFGCRAIGLDDRYAGSDDPAVDQYGRPTDRTYRDINPAVLHLIAANRIGVDKQAFVGDISPGAQVWNHPLWAYEIKSLEELRGGAAAVQWITGRAHQGAYPFNDKAKRFFGVHARYCATLALQAAGAPVNTGDQARSAWLEYRYVLETDQDGRILGGEWAGESRKNHPDFCWVPLTPTSSYTLTPDGHYVVGTTGIGNPYVVYEDVLALQQQSAGAPVAARRETGSGRWARAAGGGEPQWTRVFQVAQAQMQQAQLQQAIATLSAPLQQAQAGQVQVPAAVQQELQLQRGWLHFVQQRPREALADYAQLPDDGPLGPSVRARRALFAVASADGVRGLAEAAQAIAQNPKNPWGYTARAWVYLSRKGPHDEERALEDLKTAQSLGADPFVAWSGMQIQQQQAQAGAGQPAQAEQVQQQQVFQAQLQAMPAQVAQLFARQVRGVSVQQENK